MERTDNMEHIFLKRSDIGLLLAVEGRTVEDALPAGAGGADVPAGIAADALAQFAAEKGKFLLGRQRLNPCHLRKTVGVHGVGGFSQKLVVNYVLLALADMAALQHGGLVGQRLRAVQGLDGQIFGGVRVRRAGNTQNPVKGDSGKRQLSLAAYADDICLLPADPVLPQELVEAVGIAGLQKHQGFPLFLLCFNHVLTEIRAAEAVVDEAVQRIRRVEEGRLRVPDVFAHPPAKHTGNLTGGKELLCFFNQFLHLRSPNLTLGPRVRTADTKLFMVSENFAPSAAETHSTRVRPSSTPR